MMLKNNGSTMINLSPAAFCVAWQRHSQRSPFRLRKWYLLLAFSCQCASGISRDSCSLAGVRLDSFAVRPSNCADRAWQVKFGLFKKKDCLSGVSCDTRIGILERLLLNSAEYYLFVTVEWVSTSGCKIINHYYGYNCLIRLLLTRQFVYSYQL